MTTVFPGALDSLPRPGPTTEMDDPGFEGDGVIDNISDAIEAVQAKLGIGASTPGTVNRVLRVATAGSSSWGQVVNSDIDSAAAIGVSKLAAGTERYHLQTISGTSAWGNTPACRVRHSVDQAITHNTVTALAFNTEEFDNATLHDTATNNSRITTPIAGIWLFYTTVWFAANATGTRQLKISRQGVSDIGFNWVTAVSGQPTAMLALATFVMTAGDWADVRVWQDSGSSINILGNLTYSPVFGAFWIGPNT